MISQSTRLESTLVWAPNQVVGRRLMHGPICWSSLELNSWSQIKVNLLEFPKKVAQIWGSKGAFHHQAVVILSLLSRKGIGPGMLCCASTVGEKVVS